MTKTQRQRLERLGFFSLLALAILFAVPSLFWPLSPDQASSFYVAREWWQHNLLPYRDSFDPRTPGIHFMRLLSGILFGFNPRALRILELVVVLAAAMPAAQVAAKRRLTAIELGPPMLLASVFYFSSAGNLHSTEPEIWAAICLLAGQSILSIDRNRRRAAIVSGLWCGSALVLAPESIVFVPLYFAQALKNGITDRPEPEKAPTLVEIPLAFLIGILQPPSFFIAYFISRGAFQPFFHSVLQPDADLISWRAALANFPRLPFAIGIALWLPPALARLRQGKLRAFRIVPLLFVAALSALRVHPTEHSFVLFIPFCVVLAADGLIWLGGFWTPLPSLLAIAVATFFWFENRPATPPASDGQRLGEQLRALARPGDQLQVSGDHAEVYAASGLASPSRFFLEPRNLADSFWRPQHEAMLAAKPPRFLVVENAAPLPAGHHRVAQVGSLTLLER